MVVDGLRVSPVPQLPCCMLQTEQTAGSGQLIAVAQGQEAIRPLPTPHHLRKQKAEPRSWISESRTAEALQLQRAGWL